MIHSLDTNIILYFLSDRLLQPLPDGEYAISVITEIELLSYPRLNKQAEKQIRDFLTQLTIIELEPAVKELAIQLRKQHSLRLPDAIIAATAMSVESKLLSNDQQFLKIPRLHCVQLPLK